MPGINTTGLPNTEDYNLGRGIIYFAPYDSTTGLPLAYRDLGNAPEFSISVETETLDHQSSRAGLKVTDKEVLISQKVSLSLTLDEINFDNLASLLSGVTATHTNAIKTTQAQYEAYESVTLGRWYDIRDDDGERAYDLSASSVIVLKNGNDDVTLVENTDYTVDTVMGRVFLLSTATKIDDGDPLDMSWSADSGRADPDEVQALTQTSVIGALKFISENPASSDAQTEFQFHKVSLKAEGDFGLIGDEFSTMQFTATAEKNEAADDESPTLTIRTFAQS